MECLPLDRLFELLGTNLIPGSDKELDVLRVRIGELVALNGEQWVRDHRKRLLDEWSFAIAEGLVKT